MKKIFFIVVSIIVAGCNNDVLTDIIPEETTKPDYNVLLEAPDYFLWDKNQAHYSGKVTFYLRPFENVKPTDHVVIEVNSNRLSRFIIKNDTLYNGDKKRLQYSDFQKFFLYFDYQSQEEGNHNVQLKTTIRTVSKDASISFSTSNI